MVFDVNNDNFQAEVLDVADMPVLVDFWAPWCSPCQMQGPILNELAGETVNKAKICKVNVDENHELSSQYDIMSIPALKIFKNGVLAEEMMGVHDKNQLMAVIEKHA
ncbi:thioredoxin [Candidatus Peregrinibacteria bacterium CG_4_10_14_0_2_um_filter_43_11]|nr:MAG: thioredoxin [Candidatus Peregrinibacteria bacterium CG_4_10_14_0_2_um_filter_43_11]